MSIVSARWRGGGAFTGVCHGITKTFGGERSVDCFGGVRRVRVSHTGEEVFNFGVVGNSVQINGSIEDGVAICIVSNLKVGGVSFTENCGFEVEDSTICFCHLS